MLQIGTDDILAFKAFIKIINIACLKSSIVFRADTTAGTKVFCHVEVPADFSPCQFEKFDEGSGIKRYFTCPFNQVRAGIEKKCPDYFAILEKDFRQIHGLNENCRFYIVIVAAISTLFVSYGQKIPRMSKTFIRNLESRAEADSDFFEDVMRDFGDLNESFISAVYEIAVTDYQLPMVIWKEIVLLLWIFWQGMKEEMNPLESLRQDEMPDFFKEVETYLISQNRRVQ